MRAPADREQTRASASATNPATTPSREPDAAHAPSFSSDREVLAELASTWAHAIPSESGDPTGLHPHLADTSTPERARRLTRL